SRLRSSRNHPVKSGAADRHRNKNRFPPAARQRTALPAKFLESPWPKREKQSDGADRGPSFACALLNFCVLLACKAGKINHEAHEGHEEICYNPFRWRIGPRQRLSVSAPKTCSQSGRRLQRLERIIPFNEVD